METSIAVFRAKETRKTIHNNKWWQKCKMEQNPELGNNN